MITHVAMFFKVFVKVMLIASFVVSCSSKNNTNCKELFDKYYETNIAAFMMTIPAGTDSVVARKRCECMLNELYKIDSTFVLMNGAELDRFIKNNLAQISKCDSIK